MSQDTRNPSIHAIKYYRVVLEDIDLGKTSPATFSIKLAMRTRTPRPRVDHVLKHLPCRIKGGLSVDQANKLKSMLESLGGKARLESYVVEPGEPHFHLPEHVESLDQPATDDPTAKCTKKTCSSCGWAEPADAEICSLCLEPFAKEDPAPDMADQQAMDEAGPLTADDGERRSLSGVEKRVEGVGEVSARDGIEKNAAQRRQSPRGGTAPLEPRPAAEATDLKTILSRHRMTIFLAAIVLLLIILLLK